MTKKNIGVVLSGCGRFDGSEIHESVITLLAIDRAGHKAVCFAPDMNQHHVVNHLTGEVTSETRNVLTESARIARGDVTDIAKARGEDLDALIFPGGQGAAKNLCDFNIAGTGCRVHPEVVRLVGEIVAQGKPVGAICIAPALVAAVFGPDEPGPRLTIGTDQDTASKIEAMGSKHEHCPVKETVVDEKYKIVSTPAYMLAQSISEVADGIEKLVAEVIELA